MAVRHEAFRPRLTLDTSQEAPRHGARNPQTSDGVYQRELVRIGRTPEVGLAVSGGGIRSATFALGLLQALQRLGLFRTIDYLSTVSGGGYAGAWLYALQRRGELEKALELAGDEPRQVRFLRTYSNYLTPQLGLFQWRHLGRGEHRRPQPGDHLQRPQPEPGRCAVRAVGDSPDVHELARHGHRQRDRGDGADGGGGTAGLRRLRDELLQHGAAAGGWHLAGGRARPGVQHAGAAGGRAADPGRDDHPGRGDSRGPGGRARGLANADPRTGPRLRRRLGAGPCSGASLQTFDGHPEPPLEAAAVAKPATQPRTNWRAAVGAWAKLTAFAIPAGAIGSFLVTATFARLEPWLAPYPALAQLGMPLLVAGLMLAITAHIGLAGTLLSDETREWWARVAGRCCSSRCCSPPSSWSPSTHARSSKTRSSGSGRPRRPDSSRSCGRR